MRDHQQTICVSNATNSRSPDDLKSRIFIGNLNTSVITKRHLHLIFAQFGDIKAISMHKGYAFIQYDDQMDALNAVISQDGQVIAGQAIDVNLVTEPKPHQKSSKTSSTASNGSDISAELASEANNTEKGNDNEDKYKSLTINMTDMIVDTDSVGDHSIYSTSEQNGISNELESHINGQNCNNLDESQTKRIKLNDNEDIDENTWRSGSSEGNTANVDSNNVNENKHLTDNHLSEQNHSNSSTSSLSSLLYNQSLGLLLNNANHRLSSDNIPLALSPIQTTQQTCDILICGNCRTLFTSLPLFIQHKKSSKCRLRFVCHCHHK
ncbi:putative mediator of RNA polymerase II transcription subunit 24 [Oppia nitens]|uniref:putative mediator of RNA polymerase II transcription subunit 24 n=1 Tax=Oppia nitens TaxID=1686743 RepID=UPI0023DB7D69|nr:putative mediator of RNA polymerase II transcription subunit 24 [Oppia nitens]